MMLFTDCSNKYFYLNSVLKRQYFDILQCGLCYFHTFRFLYFALVINLNFITVIQCEQTLTKGEHGIGLNFTYFWVFGKPLLNITLFNYLVTL